MTKTIDQELKELFNTAKFLWDNHLTGAIKPEARYNFPYEMRVYNTIARIFGSVLEPCGSAVLIDKILHISYNGDKHKLLEKHRTEVKMLSTSIMKLSPDSDSILNPLGLILSFQLKNDATFRWAFKQLEKLPNNALQIVIQEFREFKQTNQQKHIDLARIYVKLLSTLDENNITLKGDEIKLIRPFQDVLKLQHVFNQIPLNKIEIFDHQKDDLHAEIALFLSKKQEFEQSHDRFLGISKYCCFICEELLNHVKINHSGAHNIFALQESILDKALFPEKEYSGFWDKVKMVLINYLRTNAAQDLQQILNQNSYVKLTEKGNFEAFYKNVWNVFLQQLEKKDEDDYLINSVAFRQGMFDVTKKKDVLNTPKQEFDISDDEEIEDQIRIFDNNQSLWKFKQKLKDGLDQKYSSSNYWKIPYDLSELDKILEEEGLKGAGAHSEEKNVDYINSYFAKYTLDALDNILTLRINDLQLKDIAVLQGIFIDQENNNMSNILSRITSSTPPTILVPLNLYNKHAAGLVFEKVRDSTIIVKYFDSLNNLISQELKQLITNILGFKVSVQEIIVEQQKYANCGPEVIENFILYLTGKRVSQEKAIELHSKLVENALLGTSYPSVHLLFEDSGELNSNNFYCTQLNRDDPQFYNPDYDNLQLGLLGNHDNA